MWHDLLHGRSLGKVLLQFDCVHCSERIFNECLVPVSVTLLRISVRFGRVVGHGSIELLS